MTTVKGNSGGDNNGNVKLQEWEGNSGGDSGNSAMARTLLQLQDNVVITYFYIAAKPNQRGVCQRLDLFERFFNI